MTGLSLLEKRACLARGSGPGCRRQVLPSHIGTTVRTRWPVQCLASSFCPDGGKQGTSCSLKRNSVRCSQPGAGSDERRDRTDPLPYVETVRNELVGVADTSKITSTSTGVPRGRLATPYTNRLGFLSLPNTSCSSFEAPSATFGCSRTSPEVTTDTPSRTLASGI